jgi:hypothetical protein
VEICAICGFPDSNPQIWQMGADWILVLQHSAKNSVPASITIMQVQAGPVEVMP